MSDLLNELTNDTTSGATGIYIKILNHIVLGFLKGKNLSDEIREKAGDMFALNYLADKLEGVPLFKQKEQAKELQKQVRADAINTGIQLFKNLSSSNNIVLCHSNSGSVLRALEHRKNRIQLVYQTHSMPGGEGKECAKTLKSMGFQVKLLADSRISTAINNGAIPVLGADAITQSFFVNKIGTSEIISASLKAEIAPIIVAGTEKACTEDTYGDKPQSKIFERIPYKKIRIIIGGSTYRMPRDKKRLRKFLEN